MRLWELAEGKKTIQWRTRLPGVSVFCRHYNILVLLLVLPRLLPLLYQWLTSVSVSCSQSYLSACVQARTPCPSLSLRKTEQVTLFPCLHIHTQHFPLQGFWLLLIVWLWGGEEGEGWCVILHPGPVFLGIVLGCPWQHLVSPPPIILQGFWSFPSPKPGMAGKGVALEEPSLAKTKGGRLRSHYSPKGSCVTICLHPSSTPWVQQQFRRMGRY